ncbi:MCE family protein [Saccharomonospora saliphila]|uniref:MCE family protein n=1 Tax=Saccharomonospora saliphila TaxID=369829 RepID=UPI00039DF170|nr:MCE family protein [Saccharomonospora saliphila]
MTTATTTRLGLRLARIASLALALAVGVAGALWWIFSGPGEKSVTLFFERTVGVYSGSDVRVLGVRVGEVTSVVPEGDRVRATATVAADAPVAADTRAAVVSPSVVADRYVQLTDLARGGDRLADGAVIPRERTAVPVELDELYGSMNDLVTALGPDGANGDGALSELLDSGADSLEGNGDAFADSVRDFAALARTLSDSDDDLFGTVESLREFTAVLAGNDERVREATEQLSEVWRSLSADRDELSAALDTLGTALADIQGFVRDHRAALAENVDKLAHTTGQLVEHRESVAEALDVAPLAVENAYNTFDPRSGTMQGRTNVLEYLGEDLPLPLITGGD